jgi:RTX calcium-binding nonapeptide repeat (4 copies)
VSGGMGWSRSRRCGSVGVLLVVALCAVSGAAADAASPPEAPGLTADFASGIGESSASLHGGVLSVMPVTSCEFEWGSTPAYGASAPCSPSVLSLSQLDEVTAFASGLAPGTLYYWRLSAANERAVGYSEALTFQTTAAPPVRSEAEETSPSREVVPRGKTPTRGRTPPRSGEAGIYSAYCPSGNAARAGRSKRARISLASHAGWPKDQCLKMDKGGKGASHTINGEKHIHNWLLGGYGNDTIWGGNAGDVIWGDYQPSGQSANERDVIHGGAGSDWIYSSHGHSEIWTGAGNDHIALVYGSGTVHCNGGGLKTLVMRFLPQNRHWNLIGCNDKRIEPYKA